MDSAAGVIGSPVSDHYVTTSIFQRDDKSASVEELRGPARDPLVLNFSRSVREKPEGNSPAASVGCTLEIYDFIRHVYAAAWRYKIDINRNKRDERASVYQAMVLYDERIKAKE
jgi:hypothetical protein